MQITVGQAGAVIFTDESRFVTMTPGFATENPYTSFAMKITRVARLEIF